MSIKNKILVTDTPKYLLVLTIKCKGKNLGEKV